MITGVYRLSAYPGESFEWDLRGNELHVSGHGPHFDGVDVGIIEWVPADNMVSYYCPRSLFLGDAPECSTIEEALTALRDAYRPELALCEECESPRPLAYTVARESQKRFGRLLCNGHQVFAQLSDIRAQHTVGFSAGVLA